MGKLDPDPGVGVAKRRLWHFAALIAGTAALAALGATAGWYSQQRHPPADLPYQSAQQAAYADVPTREPPTLPDPAPPAPASEATDIRDNAEVIGVSVGGKARAYLLKAFEGNPNHHIVNDVIDGVPITIAYCDLFHCVQVVSDPDHPGQRLHVSLYGYNEQGMKLRVGDATYAQGSLAPLVPGSPPFPYRKYPWERTTWREWKQAHPDTDIFLQWEDK